MVRKPRTEPEAERKLTDRCLGPEISGHWQVCGISAVLKIHIY